MARLSTGRFCAAFIPAVPWMLSGGLTPANVAEALRVTGAPGVDVSSGVETSPGVKDVGLIRAFVAAARGA
jgi:phosphoribosylanthranilate isomerase